MAKPRRRIPRPFVLLPAVLLGWVVMVLAWSIMFSLLFDESPKLEDIGLILNPFTIDDEFVYVVWIPAAIIVLMQFALILPLARPLTLKGTPRRPWYAAVAAGGLAALLVGGVIGLIAELPRLPYALEIVAGTDGFDPRSDAEATVDALMAWLWWVGLGMMLCTWIVWTTMLLQAMRRGALGWLPRTIRRLIAGTFLELALVLPLYLLVRRRFDCWCALPSFWSVTFAMGALLTLTGPGVVLIWRRRAGLPTDAWIDRCLICGYRRAPESGPCCPECGQRWGRTVAAPPASGGQDQG
jgi:hypothetical protein